jgi:hypothetical protein
MLPRFLMVFGLVLAYMAVWAVIFLILILIWRDTNEAVLPYRRAHLMVNMLAATVTLITFLIPYLDFVAKRVFCYTGEGEPVGEDELRALILAINEFDAPVSVEERGKKIVVTWKYNDAKWWELLARAGLKRLYELHIKLNEEKKEAVLIDVLKTVAWRAGPTEVSVRASGFRGIYAGCQLGSRWGIKENFELGEVYSFKFKPSEIKSPIANSILRSGWRVRFGIW